MFRATLVSSFCLLPIGSRLEPLTTHHFYMVSYQKLVMVGDSLNVVVVIEFKLEVIGGELTPVW